MNDSRNNTTNSPFSTPERQGPRFSLSTLLLFVVVNAAICSLLLIASKVPAINRPLSVITGQTFASDEQSERTAHFLFLIACYTTPLLVTGALSIFYHFGYRRNQNAIIESDADSDPFDEDSPFK